MSRVYSAPFAGVAVTVGQDFFEITPAANKKIKIHGIFLSQHTDVGDAAEEIVRWQVIRGFTTSGTGGTTATSTPVDGGDGAAGATVEVNNTTVATGGTGNILHADGFNVRTGLGLFLTPATMWECSAAENRLCIRLIAAPVDSLTMDGTLYYEEI